MKRKVLLGLQTMQLTKVVGLYAIIGIKTQPSCKTVGPTPLT